jgi:hypothetical protein
MDGPEGPSYPGQARGDLVNGSILLAFRILAALVCLERIGAGAALFSLAMSGSGLAAIYLGHGAPMELQ